MKIGSLAKIATRCHFSSVDVTGCHLLYHLLSFADTPCHLLYHSLSFVVTRYTIRLSFYKRSNLRDNNCAILFSIFLYSEYSFLLNSFIYKFIHAVIFLFIERKAISCLSVELQKIYQYWRCLIILSKWSTVAYKLVVYKKILADIHEKTWKWQKLSVHFEPLLTRWMF